MMVFSAVDRRDMREAVDSLTQGAWLAVEETIAWDKQTREEWAREAKAVETVDMDAHYKVSGYGGDMSAMERGHIMQVWRWDGYFRPFATERAAVRFSQLWPGALGELSLEPWAPFGMEPVYDVFERLNGDICVRYSNVTERVL